MNRIVVLVGALVLFCLPSIAALRDEGRVVYFASQPCGHYSGAKVSYTDGVWETTNAAGKKRPAVGFDVNDTSSGGLLVVRMIDDGGALCTLKVAASSGRTQTIGRVFDRVIQTGTTLALGGVTFWF